MLSVRGALTQADDCQAQAGVQSGGTDPTQKGALGRPFFVSVLRDQQFASTSATMSLKFGTNSIGT